MAKPVAATPVRVIDPELDAGIGTVVACPLPATPEMKAVT